MLQVLFIAILAVLITVIVYREYTSSLKTTLSESAHVQHIQDEIDSLIHENKLDRDQIARLNILVSQALNTDQTNSDQLRQLNQNINEVSKFVNTDRLNSLISAALAQSSAQIDNIKTQVTQLSTQNITQDTKLRDLEATNQSQSSLAQQLNETFLGQQAELQRLQLQLNQTTIELNSRIANLESSSSQSNIQSLQTNIQSLQINLQSIISSIQNDPRFAELQSDVSSLQSSVSILQTNISSLQANVSSMQSAISQIQTQINNLQPSQ